MTMHDETIGAELRRALLADPLLYDRLPDRVKHALDEADEVSTPTVDPDYDAMTVGSPASPVDERKTCCAASSPADHRACTRPTGHTGQHVAEGISTVQAVWPQDPIAESAERLIGLHEGVAS